MSYKKIFWGVFLIFIGILIILKNTGMVYFSWWSVFRLWPLLLILWGISVIPVKDYVKVILSLITVGLGLILIVNSTHYSPGFRLFNWPHNYHYRWYDRDQDNDKDYEYEYYSDEEEYSSKSQTFSEPYDTLVMEAKLNLDAAAGTFTIEDWTNDLVEFNKKGYFGNYSMTSQDIGDKRVINISLDKPRIRRVKNSGNVVNIRLNRLPVWNFDFDIGAADVTLNLEEFKTDHITIDGGACAVDLKLGTLFNETSVNIDAGASSITIRVPEEAGCELLATTVLSSRNLDDFEKIERGVYRTDNFESVNQTIRVSIDAAVSSLEIIRY